MLDQTSPITTARATRASTALLKQQQQHVKPKSQQSPPPSVPLSDHDSHSSHTGTPSSGKEDNGSIIGDFIVTSNDDLLDNAGPKSNNSSNINTIDFDQSMAHPVKTPPGQRASPDISAVEKLVSDFFEKDDRQQLHHQSTAQSGTQSASPVQSSDHIHDINGHSVDNAIEISLKDNWPVPYPPITQLEANLPTFLENGNLDIGHLQQLREGSDLEVSNHLDAFSNDNQDTEIPSSVLEIGGIDSTPVIGLDIVSSDYDRIDEQHLTGDWSNLGSESQHPATFGSQDGGTPSPDLDLNLAPAPQMAEENANVQEEVSLPPEELLDSVSVGADTKNVQESNPIPPLSSMSPLSHHRLTPSISSPRVRGSALYPPHPMDSNSDSPLRRGMRLSPSWASGHEQTVTPLRAEGALPSNSPPVRASSVSHSAFHPPVVVRNDGPLTASIIEHEKEELVEMKKEADGEAEPGMDFEAGGTAELESTGPKEESKMEDDLPADAAMDTETHVPAPEELIPAVTDEHQPHSTSSSTTMGTDNTAESSGVVDGSQSRREPLPLPPPSPIRRFAGDPKVAVVLEINHELIGICMAYGGQPGQPPIADIEPYHARMTSNLNWLASVADSNANHIKPGTQFALPVLQPPPPLPPSQLSAQLSASVQKLPELYSKMQTLFKVDYERRMRREAKLKMTRSTGINGSAIPPAVVGVKRDRPDGDSTGISPAAGDLRKRMTMEGAIPGGGRIAGMRSSSVSSVNSPVLSNNAPGVPRNPMLGNQMPQFQSPTSAQSPMQSSPAPGVGGVVGISTPFQQRQQPYQIHQPQTSPSPAQQHFMMQNTAQQVRDPSAYASLMTSSSPSNSNHQHGIGLGVMVPPSDHQNLSDRHQISFDNLSSQAQSVNKHMIPTLSQNAMTGVGSSIGDGLSASAHLLNHGANPVAPLQPDLSGHQSNPSPTSLISSGMPMTGGPGSAAPSPQQQHFLNRAPSLGVGTGGQQGMIATPHLGGAMSGLQSHETGLTMTEEQQRMQMQFRQQMPQSHHMSTQLFHQPNPANNGTLSQMSGAPTGHGVVGNLGVGNAAGPLQTHSNHMSNGMSPSISREQQLLQQQQESHGPSQISQTLAQQISQSLRNPAHPLTAHLTRTVRGFATLPEHVQLQVAHRTMQQQTQMQQQNTNMALNSQAHQGQQQQQPRPPSAAGIPHNIAGLRALRQGTSSPRIQGNAVPQALTPPSSMSKPPPQHQPHHPPHHQRQPSGGFLSSPVPSAQPVIAQQGLGQQQRQFMLQQQHQHQQQQRAAAAAANSPPSSIGSGGMEPPPNPTPLQLHQSISRRTRSPSETGSPHQQQHFQSQQSGSIQSQQHSPVSMSSQMGRQPGQQSPYGQFQNQQLPMQQLQSVQQPTHASGGWSTQGSYINHGWGPQASAGMTPQHKSAANSPYTGAGMGAGFTIAASPSSSQQQSDLLQSQHMMDMGDVSQEYSGSIDPSALFNWPGGGGHGM